MFTSSHLRGLLDAGLTGDQVLIFMYLNEQSEDFPGELRCCAQSVGQVAAALGRSTHQVKRAIAALVDAGAIVRRQAVKVAGETALTVLTDRGLAWLGSRAGEGAIPADLPLELRQLLVFESASFVAAVAKAWREREPLDPSLLSECRSGAECFERVAAHLRDQVLEAAEAMAQAYEGERADQEKLAAGVVAFDCDDGVVDIDAAVFREHKGAVAAVDLLWCRDVLRRVRELKPGFVTVGKLPELVAEIGYSRTVGFVAKHDAEQAQRALVLTMAKRAWSRPKGIRETFYQAANTASRFSTGVRHVRH